MCDEFRGISDSLRVAANLSSIGFVRSAMTAFMRARFAAAFATIFLRRLFFSTALFFALSSSLFDVQNRLQAAVG